MKNDLTLDQRLAEFRRRLNISVACLEDEYLETIKKWGTARMYPAESELFRQGKKASTVYFIEDGIVGVSRLTSSGARILIGIRTPTWFLEPGAVLSGRPHSVTAITLTQCSLRPISADKFLMRMETDADFRRHIECMLSSEIRSQIENAEMLGAMSGQNRLKHLLLKLLLAQGKNDTQSPITLELPMTHLQMGELIGVTPEHFSRLLKKMEDQQLIRREKNRLIILDTANLIDVVT